MDLNDLGITEEQVSEYLRPIIQKVMKEEFSSSIRDAVKEEVRPAIENIPSDLQRYVNSEMATLRAQQDSQRVLQSNPQVDCNVIEYTEMRQPQRLPQVQTPQDNSRMDMILNMIMKLIGSASDVESDPFDKIVNKFAKQEQQRQTLLAALGASSDPSPELINKAMYEGVKFGVSTGAKIRGTGGDSPTDIPFPEVPSDDSSEELVNRNLHSNPPGKTKLSSLYKKGKK